MERGIIDWRAISMSIGVFDEFESDSRKDAQNRTMKDLIHAWTLNLSHLLKCITNFSLQMRV